MNRNRIATPIVAAISVTDELYQFLKAHHKFEAFEGRNRDRWSDYSQSVARSYQQMLDKRGFARIPAYETCAGEAVYFDQALRLIEGERLKFAQRSRLQDFDQRAFLGSTVLSSFGVQTLSLGECVMGIAVTTDGRQIALVWSSAQDANAESRVLAVINRALCNSSNASTFLELLKAKPTDVCVELQS